jgi:predicted phage terminase large subunit-like protein
MNTPLTEEQQQSVQNIKLMLQLVRQQKEASDCADSLRKFVKAAWPLIGLGTPYAHGWHIDAICEHLEAVARRDIRRLIINMPPRFGKSSIVSVAFSAWRWIKCPEEKFLSTSYSTQLSFRDSRYTRNLIRNDWYQKRWGDKFKITKDQNEKGHFENSAGGYRIATSKDANTTGHGGSVRIYDDPNNLKTINSKAERESENEYHKVMATRAVDPKTDVEICVQQRGHPDDMTGLLLNLGWELLCLPNEFEGNHSVTSIGWRDPRTHMGELMHAERLGPLETEDLKRTLQSDYAGQFQQRPAALAGNALKREWWRFWNPRMDDLTPEQRDAAVRPIKLKLGAETVERTAQQIPDAFEQVCQSWDMAFKDMEHNDFVAGHAWGRLGANSYMLARDHGHYDFPKTCAAVRRMSLAFPCPEKLVEDKANGPAVIQSLRNEIPGMLAVNDAGGKIARVNAIAGYVEAGNVWLPNPNLYQWVWDLIDEFSDFPAVTHDDDTDAMTQALKRLFDSMANNGLPEFRVQPRVGEPQTACHIEPETDMVRGIPAHWRRWIAVAPGHPGCALWLAETPTGSLRVYRELELLGADALEAGKRIAACSIPDLEAWLGSIRAARHWHIDLLLEKMAFAPVEPVGSYAALLEQGILEYEPVKGEWDDRQYAKQALKAARFTAQAAMLEESAVDRLRSLLQFAPPNFQELEYDRKKAFALSREDLAAYTEYMAAVEGRISGEWPKLKISSQCRNLISALGCARRDEQIDTPDPFLRALLIGVSAPASVMASPGIREVPALQISHGVANMRGRTRKFGR